MKTHLDLVPRRCNAEPIPVGREQIIAPVEDILCPRSSEVALCAVKQRVVYCIAIAGVDEASSTTNLSRAASILNTRIMC